MSARGLQRALTTVAAALLLAAPHGRLGAQEDRDYDPFHWGYAPMFGSGVYRQMDGTEARIARIAPSVVLREARIRSGPNLGVRLLLPFSVGIQELDAEDLPPDRPDDQVEHAAILPGIELEFPAERFALRVRGQAGWGTELEGREMSARLYAFGLRSRYGWPDAPGRPALINGLMWAGFVPETGPRRSLLRLSQGIEFDVSVPRWQFKGSTMRLMPHVLADWYYRPPPELGFGDDDFDHVETEWQVGLAAKREEGFKLLWFEFRAVGIAYRFSEHSNGIRFYLNSVF